MDILNDVEQAAVQQFINFETMREAVKKVLLAALYHNGTLKPGKKAEPLVNAALTFAHQFPNATDELIGQQTRALYKAVMLLEEGFKQLESYKKVEAKPAKPIQAR